MESVGLTSLSGLAVTAVAVGVAGCASSPSAPTAGAATINYMASDCAQIAEEIKLLEARMKDSEAGRDPGTTGCRNAAGLLGVGAGFAVGATCTAGGPTSAGQVEYAHVRAELNAARDAASQKRCAKAAP